MHSFRQYSLTTLILVCGWLGASPLFSQQPTAPPKPKPASPFESVPQAVPEAPKPQAPKMEAPKPTEGPAAGTIQDIVEVIEFRGARRVPQDTLRALIFTKKGDKYDPESLNRDFMALWNTGRFDDIRMEREEGKIGWIVRFVVTERRVVRSIKYDGAKSVTVSEILDRFKDRRVGLQVESQYDPNKVQRAANVLKEYLAERGRQFATVEPEIRQIPPSSLEVVFKVNEGPKVKVGKIEIDGNQVFSDRVVRAAMKNLRPVGIPKSILFENLFAKTFDSTKLEEDKDRVRVFYQEQGYFTARSLEHELKMVDTQPAKIRPFIFWPKGKPGKKADLKITVEEGRLYRLNKFSFEGVKFFRTPETLFPPIFAMKEGDVFSTAKLRKGLEQMRKFYGEFGFLDFVPEPSFDPSPDGKLNLLLSVEEGKQFFVRRIDFQGNTTTRDKVIRREILIDEGDLFNSRFWELSILRLNQLGYFEALKAEEAATINRDTKNNTVDITLKVKERGRNSVQLSGGVSGIAGSFVSFGYSTNNFLGLGETLSLDSQLGDRIRSTTFGFTEPYLFDKPIQAGFTVFFSRFNFDQGREVSLLSGRNLAPLYNALGSQNLLNYVTNGYGFSAFASMPLRRTFARVSLTYQYNLSNVTPTSEAAKTYFEYSNFLNIDGPNQLNGIKTSSIIPSYTYNTVDHPITPTRGKSLFASLNFASSYMGGNVNMIEPTIDAKYFRAGFNKKHVLGMHLLGRYVTGYGGKNAPPFNRFYMGGENDIRGFDIWGISPVAFVPSSQAVPVLNADGSVRQQKFFDDKGAEFLSPVTTNIPHYQIIFPGGDTQVVTNVEYRIPIVGPVWLAAFADTGVNRVTNQAQLTLNPGRLNSLNFGFPQVGFPNQAVLATDTQKIRMSTGLELQVMMPVVNAPFRFYWAYNPLRLQTFVAPPIVADRSYFPNEATFINAAATVGQPLPYFERARVFRFTISRTF